MSTAAHNKTSLRVAGLVPEVSRELLYAAFLPFGEITDWRISGDKRTHQDRPAGHGNRVGFVTFAEVADATAALDNMHQSELLGHTISVSASSRPPRPAAPSNRAIWATEGWDQEGGVSPDGLVSVVTTAGVAPGSDADADTGPAAPLTAIEKLRQAQQS